jgi:hypothetical protein
MSTDQFMGRVYNARSYNCAHFVCDVWEQETGQHIGDTLAGVLHAPRERKLKLPDVHRVTVLASPESPCLVLMRNRWESHVGVYLRGKVLHLIETGVQYVPLDVACIGFPKVRFFRC